ncbi:MAG: helix-turn-helix transcriptional regulator [Rhizobiaceae bacterium]|nr:helix-turn-helix transcriptional regulator [Rhizobiaceae bacterium]
MADSANPAKDSSLSRALARIDQRLSHDLRALRLAKSLTLAQISEKIGRSVGWLSQVERGISMPTLPDLRRMAEAFGVPLSLFDTRGAPAEPESGVVVRADQRRHIGPAAGGMSEELLSPSLGGASQMRRRVMQPGAAAAQPARRDVEESGYVLSGRLTLEVDGTIHTLEAGDSFRFKGKAAAWCNDGDEEAVVVWVMSPPAY